MSNPPFILFLKSVLASEIGRLTIQKVEKEVTIEIKLENVRKGLPNDAKHRLR